MMDGDVVKGLVGVVCKLRVDGIVVKGRTPEEMLEKFLLMLIHLFKTGLFAAAHKCSFSTRSVTWCRK